MFFSRFIFCFVFNNFEPLNTSKPEVFGVLIERGEQGGAVRVRRGVGTAGRIEE